MTPEQLREKFDAPPHLHLRALSSPRRLETFSPAISSPGFCARRCNCADCDRTRGSTERQQLTSLQLAIATLATTFSIAAFSLSGGEKVDKTQPPINAKSKDEESFVK